MISKSPNGKVEFVDIVGAGVYHTVAATNNSDQHEQKAVLQIPFGWLSDKIGRKPVILAGLTLFALGSLVAGMAETVEGLVVGRFLQGSGAIAGTVMALLADLTRDEQRTKAMDARGPAP